MDDDEEQDDDSDYGGSAKKKRGQYIFIPGKGADCLKLNNESGLFQRVMIWLMFCSGNWFNFIVRDTELS